jgi:hypothetical protein
LPTAMTAVPTSSPTSIGTQSICCGGSGESIFGLSCETARDCRCWRSRRGASTRTHPLLFTPTRIVSFHVYEGLATSRGPTSPAPPRPGVAKKDSPDKPRMCVNMTGSGVDLSKNKTGCELSTCIASFREWATAGGKCNLLSRVARWSSSCPVTRQEVTELMKRGAARVTQQAPKHQD